MKPALTLASVTLVLGGCATNVSTTSGGGDGDGPPKAPNMASCAIQGDAAHIGGDVVWSAKLEGDAMATGVAVGPDGTLWFGANVVHDVQFTCADVSPGEGDPAFDAQWVGAIAPSGALRFQSRLGAGEGSSGQLAFDPIAGIGVVAHSTSNDGIDPDRGAAFYRVAGDGSIQTRTLAGTAASPYDIRRISVAADGATFILGTYEHTLRFGADTLTAPPTRMPFFVGAISPAGEPLWARELEQSDDLAALPDGGVAVLGFADNTLWQDVPKGNLYVARFDAGGAHTTLLHRDRRDHFGNHIAADAQGDIAFGASGHLELVDAAGQTIWSQAVSGTPSTKLTSPFFSTTAIAIDADRRVSALVTAAYGGRVLVGSEVVGETAAPKGVGVLLTFDPSGSVVGHHTFPIDDGSQWGSLAIAPDRSLVASGTLLDGAWLARFPAP